MTCNGGPLLDGRCPVCSHSVAVPFFEGGDQPLAILAWPESSQEAKGLRRYPLNYVMCPQCTHVWNRSFSPETLPYEKQPNLMFNDGDIWQGHLSVIREEVIAELPPNPTVIEIGCGEGHFIKGIAQALDGGGRFIGFDPLSSLSSTVDLEFYGEYFSPELHVPKFEPDLLIMRHVLEHLTDQASLMEKLAWSATQLSKPVFFFAETPCIDKALATHRLVDFYQEHPSQFTTSSFAALMRRGGDSLTLDHGYDGEVVYALIELGVSEVTQQNAKVGSDFFHRAENSRLKIREHMERLIADGQTVAIWGGTGKAAAFMHYFDVDAKNFPLVVDSDPKKVGTYVPKTGQLIQYRDALKTVNVDVIIIPTRWRAKDILREIRREGIHVTKILVEEDGGLIELPNEPENQHKTSN